MELTVPKRLLEAANRLKDNKIIYCGLPDDMKEVVKLATKQKVLTGYISNGKKNDLYGYMNNAPIVCYCLPDDIEIVVEQEQTWWEKEGLIVCKIEKQKTRTGWEIDYPDGSNYGSETLGTLCCKSYEFVGFVHNDKIEDWSDIRNSAFGYFDVDGTFWYVMKKGRTPSTATHTVWRKIAVK